MRACVHACMCVCVYACRRVCVHACMRVCVYVCVCMRVCVYAFPKVQVKQINLRFQIYFMYLYFTLQ